MRQPGRLRLQAGPADAGTLLAFVCGRGGVSEEAVLGAVARGAAFLRGKREKDAQALVAPGDRVEIVLTDARESVAALERERVLHLDARVLAVDKPAGVSAQEDRGGGAALPQLCSALLASLGEKDTQALLVHRLDRGTTGVTVLARTRSAQGELLEEFREHRARKEYRALVAGAPARDEGVIDVRLGADPRGQGLRRKDPRGEPARTLWKVLERYDGATLLSAFPETGRTHQVRVHLRELGCPLLGDTRYGGPALLTRPDGLRIDCARPLLHAFTLQLAGLRLLAPLPEDFRKAQDLLRR